MATAKGSATRARTEFRGVYVTEVTDLRKLNQGRKKDFAFDITYKVKVDNEWVQKWEVVGWKSEGWTAEKAFDRLGHRWFDMMSRFGWVHSLFVQ